MIRVHGDVASGACVQTLAGHTDALTKVALFRWAAASSEGFDRTVRVWDASSGRCLQTFMSIQHRHCRGLGPDGRMTASSSYDERSAPGE